MALKKKKKRKEGDKISLRFESTQSCIPQPVRSKAFVIDPERGKRRGEEV